MNSENAGDIVGTFLRVVYCKARYISPILAVWLESQGPLLFAITINSSLIGNTRDIGEFYGPHQQARYI